MTNCDDLPSEILVHIIETRVLSYVDDLVRVPYDADVGTWTRFERSHYVLGSYDLIQLAMTSKRMYSIVQSRHVMWRTFLLELYAEASQSSSLRRAAADDDNDTVTVMLQRTQLTRCKMRNQIFRRVFLDAMDIISDTQCLEVLQKEIDEQGFVHGPTYAHRNDFAEHHANQFDSKLRSLSGEFLQRTPIPIGHGLTYASCAITMTKEGFWFDLFRYCGMMAIGFAGYIMPQTMLNLRLVGNINAEIEHELRKLKEPTVSTTDHHHHALHCPNPRCRVGTFKYRNGVSPLVNIEASPYCSFSCLVKAAMTEDFQVSCLGCDHPIPLATAIGMPSLLIKATERWLTYENDAMTRKKRSRREQKRLAGHGFPAAFLQNIYLTDDAILLNCLEKLNTLNKHKWSDLSSNNLRNALHDNNIRPAVFTNDQWEERRNSIVLHNFNYVGYAAPIVTDQVPHIYINPREIDRDGVFRVFCSKSCAHGSGKTIRCINMNCQKVLKPSAAPVSLECGRIVDHAKGTVEGYVCDRICQRYYCAQLSQRLAFQRLVSRKRKHPPAPATPDKKQRTT